MKLSHIVHILYPCDQDLAGQVTKEPWRAMRGYQDRLLSTRSISRIETREMKGGKLQECGGEEGKVVWMDGEDLGR